MLEPSVIDFTAYAEYINICCELESTDEIEIMGEIGVVVSVVEQ